MSKIKRVYLIGLGAIGGMIACRLQEHGHCELKIIVDDQRRKKYMEQGVTINGKACCFDFLSPDEADETADLIILAVKNHHLDAAIKQIRPFVGQNTHILSLLNGIDSEMVIGREFGIEKLLYSFIVATDAVRIGTNIQYSNIGKIFFGEKGMSTPSSRVEMIRSLFESADIPCEIPKDILRELWWKFMMNVGVNQTSAILKAPYGVYARSQTARDLMRDACLEVVQVAQKAGIALVEADIDTCYTILANLSADKKTSMLQDVEACRKTEVEAFSGTVIRLGQEYGVQTPVNQVLNQMIRVIEENY
ncbi:MAG: ketopantoate reductase family protein [Thermoclostridium sp.]|nr:ketopantoate reductase family protein [Thermoclostridium sp.]